MRLGRDDAPDGVKSVLSGLPRPLAAVMPVTLRSCSVPGHEGWPGRWDWAYAVERGHDPAWDDFAAQESLRFIVELRDLAPALYEGMDDGIKKLMELHRIIGKFCDDYRHSRFEEGSEHFFAYCFEHVTGRTLMHGELVALGVLIMSSLQGNKPELVREIVRKAGVRHRPDELGYTMEEVDRTLQALPAFVKSEKLWYSIANDLVVGDRELSIARKAVEF